MDWGKFPFILCLNPFISANPLFSSPFAAFPLFPFSSLGVPATTSSDDNDSNAQQEGGGGGDSWGNSSSGGGGWGEGGGNSSTPASYGDTSADSGEPRTVFVGQLSWNVDNDWLESEFAECGSVVSARVVMDRETGRSRGFGYVEFATSEEATKALEFNGKDVDGRNIKVDLSLPRPPRGEGGGGGYGGGGEGGGMRGGRSGGGGRGGFAGSGDRSESLSFQLLSWSLIVADAPLLTIDETGYNPFDRGGDGTVFELANQSSLL